MGTFIFVQSKVLNASSRHHPAWHYLRMAVGIAPYRLKATASKACETLISLLDHAENSPM